MRAAQYFSSFHFTTNIEISVDFRLSLPILNPLTCDNLRVIPLYIIPRKQAQHHSGIVRGPGSTKGRRSDTGQASLAVHPLFDQSTFQKDYHS
jgi:hypothetical protein